MHKKNLEKNYFQIFKKNKKKKKNLKKKPY